MCHNTFIFRPTLNQFPNSVPPYTFVCPSTIILKIRKINQLNPTKMEMTSMITFTNMVQLKYQNKKVNITSSSTTVHLIQCANGLIVLCFIVVTRTVLNVFLMDTYNFCTNTVQDYFIATGAIIRLSQYCAVKRLLGLLSLTWINFTPTWISINIQYKVWDEINYPFPNLSGCAVEVWKCKNNLIATLYWECDYLSMLGLKLNHVSKRGPWRYG